jgi:thioredoxin reductase (NADPH)
MEDLQAQAQRFETQVRFGSVTKIDFSDKIGGIHTLEIDGGTKVEAETVIIATGASAKYLGLPSEQRLRGGGVSACATCDGFFYKNQDIIVVGGGDTAAEEATYLSKICRKVTLLLRRDELRASKAMQNRVFNTPNIEVLFNTEIDEVLGAKTVEAVRVVNNKTQEKKDIPVTGVFIAIGHKPNTELFVDQLDMDDNKYLITKGKSSKTNKPGVFACGDVQDHEYRQAVTAAGSGCMAALDAERYLSSVE